MKKLLLILSVCLMGVSLYAEGDQPLVIVHKSNGGYWAWLNLYNDIMYVPSEDGIQPAMLECSGAGFSSCRVPRQTILHANYPTHPNNVDLNGMITDAINEIIAKSEENGQRGVLQGSNCKKIAVRNCTRGGMDTYFIQGAWKYNSRGEGYIKIYISQSDILNHRI